MSIGRRTWALLAVGFLASGPLTVVTMMLPLASRLLLELARNSEDDPAQQRRYLVIHYAIGDVALVVYVIWGVTFSVTLTVAGFVAWRAYRRSHGGAP